MLSLRSLASLFLIASTTLVGCDDDSTTTPEPEPEPVPAKLVKFADASAAQRAAVLRAVTGVSVAQAYLDAVFAAAGTDVAEGEQPGAATCPKVTVVGTKTIYDAGAGCSSVPTESKYAGKLEVEGDIALFGDGGPFSLTFTDFKVEGPFGKREISGTFSQTDNQTPFTAKVDLTIKEDMAVSIQNETTCSPTCVPAPGAKGSLVGVGGFTYTADFSRDKLGYFKGFVELTGQDKLRMDLADPDDNKCRTTTVDAKPAPETCGIALGRDRELVFVGYSSSCLPEGGYTFDVDLTRAATSVKMTARLAGKDDVVLAMALAADAEDLEPGHSRWAASSESDVFPLGCLEYSDAGAARFDAVLADGTAGCRIDGDRNLFPGAENADCE
jgi:hypothetical protein